MRISSSLPAQELLALAKKFDILLLDPQVLGSEEAVKLAEELAKRSFAGKRNISKQERFEFLLWLSGKRDISSAISETSFRTPSDILLFVFSGDPEKIARELKAGKLPLKLDKRADAMEIEKMGLSRI